MPDKSISRKIFNILNCTFLLILGLAVVYPMWHVVCASFSNPQEIIGYNKLLLYPRSFSTVAFKKMLDHPLILKSYLNTFYIVGASSILSIVMTSLCAYILSVKNVYWNKYLSIMVLVTMFFNGGIITNYLLIAKWLKLNDTFAAIILPSAINVYNMIIMRTSFESIPDSLRESAHLDGAGHIRVLLSIVLPLSKSILAVITLYYAVAQWNSWFNASLFLKTRGKYPLQLVLREILIESNTNFMAGAGTSDQAAVGEIIKYAVIVFGTLPILCVYPFLQKYFTKGVMIGAVKG